MTECRSRRTIHCSGPAGAGRQSSSSSRYIRRVSLPRSSCPGSRHYLAVVSRGRLNQICGWRGVVLPARTSTAQTAFLSSRAPGQVEIVSGEGILPARTPVLGEPLPARGWPPGRSPGQRRTLPPSIQPDPVGPLGRAHNGRAVGGSRRSSSRSDLSAFEPVITILNRSARPFICLSRGAKCVAGAAEGDILERDSGRCGRPDHAARSRAPPGSRRATVTRIRGGIEPSYGKMLAEASGRPLWVHKTNTPSDSCVPRVPFCQRRRAAAPSPRGRSRR